MSLVVLRAIFVNSISRAYIYMQMCCMICIYIYIHRNHIILECGVQQYIQCVYLHMYIIYIWVQWSMPTKCNFYVIHTSYHPSFWRSQSDWLFRARSARSLLIQALQAFVGGFPYGLTTSKWPFDVGKMMKIITCQMEWDNICSDKPSVVVKKWKTCGCNLILKIIDGSNDGRQII